MTAIWSSDSRATPIGSVRLLAGVDWRFAGSFPLTASGKVKKFELRRRLAATEEESP